MAGMTLGEKLLDLSAEYQQSKTVRDGWSDTFGGKPHGREPSKIAAEYETALRELLVGAEERQ